MKITKFGHSCLLIEDNGTRIITDPGTYSTQQNDVDNIDCVLITHEHADHFSIDSVKIMFHRNPDLQIITNSSVGALLQESNISFHILEDGQSMDIKGISIEAVGNDHAFLHTSIPCIQNTAYLISKHLFFPGDSFTIPTQPVELLALPVAGPWTRLQESIDYALQIKPRLCFPIHDGILKSPGGSHLIPPKVLEPAGIEFKILDIDTEYQL